MPNEKNNLNKKRDKYLYKPFFWSLYNKPKISTTKKTINQENNDNDYKKT